ncbi:hypothetical protein SUGI_1090370 [Cryptomeria japonica]|nr:hypothetical protein SUGI_1090370 [Cryptomeria japonica]
MVTEMATKYLFLAITMIIAAHYCTSIEVDEGDTLLLGASLTGNQTLISQNGTFALGFFRPKGTNNWYIGIWYAPVSQKAIVWVANRENPVRNMPGVLKFSRDGHLRLFDKKGRSVWSTDASQKGSRAVITDSGNFIMLSVQDKTRIVWESFGHPGNTWLPGMKLWKGMKLTSWKSSVDPAVGLFSLEMDKSPGKTATMMLFNNTVQYWSSGECVGQNAFTKVPELEGQKKVQSSCVRVSPSRIYINFSINPIDHTLTGRFLLNENGEVELYFWMDDGSWSLRWSTYRGQCSDYEICGAYGLCSANDVCSCVQGFTPKNGSQGWWSNGCARRRPLHCSVAEGTTDGFFEAKNQYLSGKEAVLYNKLGTQQGCLTACRKNCSCTAFAFAVSDPQVCRLWFGDLFGMRVSSEGQSVFVRLAASELPQVTSKQNNKSPTLTILLSAAASLFAISALLSAAFILWKRRKLRKKNVEEQVPMSLKKFTYKELRIATENFKHKLGSGAFGSVFKGTLADNTPVAVKRLEGSTQAEKQFRAEIITTGRIQHMNLVRLWGFCVEHSQRLLVYAYMSNGSLNSFLFSKSEDAEKVLDWKTRFGIALGTARGLLYLHEECRDRIIHCDIKPENILLDADFSPKIRKGNFIGIVDARIASEANIEEVRRAAVVAVLCIQDDETERPSMSEVVKILEGTMEAPVPQIPRFLQVLLDQVEDIDSCCKHHTISSGLVPGK